MSLSDRSECSCIYTMTFTTVDTDAHGEAFESAARAWMANCNSSLETLVGAVNRLEAVRAKDLDRIEALEKRVADMQSVLDRAADDGR